MAKKNSARKAVRKTLGKEVNLPIKLPDNKVGKALGKKRRLPFAKYVGESVTEMRKVTWPSRKEAIKLTFAVIVFTGIFMIIISVADFLISNVVERILL